MSRAAFAAAAAGPLAVAAAWEALAAAEPLAAAVRRALAPLGAVARSGHDPTASERRRLVGVVAISAFLAGAIVAGPALGAVLAAAGPLAVRQSIAARRRRWRAGLCAGAPHAARALADALAAGRSLRGAITDVAAAGGIDGAGEAGCWPVAVSGGSDGAGEAGCWPVAVSGGIEGAGDGGPSRAAAAGGSAGACDAELRRAAAALAFGESTDIVLERIRQRAADPAWDLIVAAALLLRDAGGDLAGLLRTIAADLDAIARVEAEARSATGQARYTARVVAILPVATVVVAELASPGCLVALAARPLTATLAVIAVALQAVALLAVRHICRAAP